MCDAGGITWVVMEGMKCCSAAKLSGSHKIDSLRPRPVSVSSLEHGFPRLKLNFLKACSCTRLNQPQNLLQIVTLGWDIKLNFGVGIES
jgi:hypothetical protein